MTTELTGLGSAPAAQDAGNPAGSNGAAPNGSGATAAATDNSSQPPQADNLSWAKAKGWVTAEGQLDTAKLAEGYTALEKRLGAIKSVPDEKATADQWDNFHKSLGWPGEAKGYEFKRPDGLPENLPYDDTMATRFKDWANEARLSPKQAQTLHDGYVKQFAADLQALEAETMTRAKAAHENLVKQWGDPKSETYIQNRDAATRALRNVEAFKGLEDELKASGLLTKEGYFTSPVLANALSALGRMSQNDTLVTGQGSSGSGNPFAKETYNLTEASKLSRQDPAKARTLAKAAGWSDKDIDW